MAATEDRHVPPYLRIASAIREDIISGRLRPGDRIPSTRQIIGRWGVAMATATKALDTLRREGLVEPRSGVGTVVRSRRRALPAAPGHPGIDAMPWTLHRAIDAATTIADDHGLDAVSMRRVAEEITMATMSLYRYVASKDELILLMARAAFTDTLPEPGPTGWRSRLEAVCRAQWELYRRHPWLTRVVSFSRPLLVPEAMAHTEWTLAALESLGLDPDVAVHEAVTLPAFVRGIALTAVEEVEAERASGLTNPDWWSSSAHDAHTVLDPGRFPRLAAAHERAPHDPDTLFRNGLTRYLDGLAASAPGRQSA